MTLEEQKIAACEKLPELIQKVEWHNPHTKESLGYHYTILINNERREIDWKWNGLQVCHAAEKLLFINIKDWESYRSILSFTHRTKTHNTFAEAHITAPYEQRLEALCRVWFPERFI